MTGSAHILRANSRSLPLADDSVDLVVTSPPYFALRSYQDGGEHYAGQIGDEPTPAAFVDSLLEVTRECMRVLKPSGSLWVNLGDKYNSAASNQQTGAALLATRGAPRAAGQIAATGGRTQAVASIRTKSLIGIPWRYALRCIDELGLILRAEVVWAKSNGLPESVQDRVRRSHEQWFWFEQSGGVEAATQGFPFCPLCGRPVDARSTLVARLKELDGRIEPGDLPDHVGPDVRVDGEHTACGDHEIAVGLGETPVPMLEALDPKVAVDAANLVQDRSVAVVDADAQQRPTLPLHEGDGPFSVDDPGKPSNVCECVGHPLIIEDEPWLPQSLAAEIMQRVADGEIDPQQAADFLSGDYVRNHSVWFHFTLNPRYYSAVDEIREAHTAPSRMAGVTAFGGRNASIPRTATGEYDGPNPLGKLPGSVWEIATEPLKVPAHLGIDHFAAFPTEWPRRIIQGWSPAGVCTACGEGRRPVADKTLAVLDRGDVGARGSKFTDSHQWHEHNRYGQDKVYGRSEVTITGYACACPEPTAPTTPSVILDPFGGTGTTALVAKALGRHGISVDMSADYCRLATWRTNDPDQIAKAMRVDKPAKQVEGQISMLDLLEDGGAA